MKNGNKPSVEGKKAEKALKEAVAKAIEEHRRIGLPVAVMRNGKAVFVPAEKAMKVVRESAEKYNIRKKYNG